MNSHILDHIFNSEKFKHRFIELSILENAQKSIYFDRIESAIQNKTTVKLEKNEPIWHYYSFQKVTCKSNQEAKDAYNSLYFKNFLILPSNPKIKGIYCQSTKGISYRELKEVLTNYSFIGDLYIVHSNMKWIFSIPHEDEFGPYFFCNKAGK